MIIAAAQFPTVPGDIGANAARMAALVARAAERGATLVVFAELALSHYDVAAVAADPEGMTVTDDDARLAPVRDACRAFGVAAVVNAAARATEGARGPTITSFVFGPDGALLTRYDKRHVAEGESAVFVPGAADGRFTLGGVRFALATCFDNHFPEVAARAAADGCGVYLASSFHSSVERVERYAELARENGLHVLLANTDVGTPASSVGLSGAWQPDGRRVATASGGTAAGELVLTDVPVHECGEPLVDVRGAAPRADGGGAEGRRTRRS
jgi:D-alanyl-D-alanine dipeptidase